MVRRKDRYFVCEVIYCASSSSSATPTSGLTKDALLQALRDSIRDCHGVYGLAVLDHDRSNVRIKHLNPATAFVIFRCLRAHHRLFWSALTFIRGVAGKECFLNTLHVGATLRSCETFVTKHHKRKLVEMLGQAKCLSDKVEIQKLIIQTCSGT